MTIDAGALTGNGGNCCDDGNVSCNEKGAFGIKASLQSIPDRMKVSIYFPSPGYAIGWMLVWFASRRRLDKGNKSRGRGRGDETIGSAENLFTALLTFVYINGCSLIISLSRLIPILAPNDGGVERVYVKNAGSESL